MDETAEKRYALAYANLEINIKKQPERQTEWENLQKAFIIGCRLGYSKGFEKNIENILK